MTFPITHTSSAIIGLMPVEFSKHAREQIKARGLTKKAIIEVVRNPEQIMSSYKGRKLRQKEVGGKLVEVVTKSEGSRIMVITAYPLED